MTVSHDVDIAPIEDPVEHRIHQDQDTKRCLSSQKTQPLPVAVALLQLRQLQFQRLQ